MQASHDFSSACKAFVDGCRLQLVAREDLSKLMPDDKEEGDLDLVIEMLTSMSMEPFKVSNLRRELKELRNSYLDNPSVVKRVSKEGAACPQNQKG